MTLRVLLLFLLLATGPASADIVVGVAAPLSGAFAPVGQEIVAGARLAAERLNAAGGILGEDVTVEALDDKCDGTTGAAVANQLVGRGAALVVGHACTAAALPAAAVYAANGIVFISPAATNPRLTDEAVGSTVFRLAPRSDLQPVAIGDRLARDFPGGRVAFVHDGGVYGQGFVEAVRQIYERAGNKAVATLPFTPGEASQNALVGQLQDGAVSAVVIGGLQADTAVIAAEMRARGLDATIFGTEAVALEEFRDLAGSAAEGVVFAEPAEDATGRQAAEILAALQTAGIDPPGAAIPAMAAVEVFAAAAEVLQSRGAASIAKALRDQSFDTVAGPVQFDAKGDRIGGGWRLMTWRGGAPVPLD